MKELFCGWEWGAMTVHNVVSVKTGRSGMRIRGRGNTKCYQLGVKFSGAVQLCYKGEEIDFTPGTAVFLPREQSEDIDYTTLTVEQGSGVCIFFETELPLPNEPQILRNIGDECENAFLRLLTVYSKSDRYNYPDVMAAFYSLLGALCKKSKSNEATRERNKRFDDVIAYMQRHICDEYLDIGRMSLIADMSEKYFRDAFKENFGLSPLRYFHQLKIDRIKTLISDLGLSIAEVARLSGFSDPNYFSRFFKKHFGVSPREYRMHYCKGL